MSAVRSISRVTLLACLVACLWGATGRATMVTMGDQDIEASQIEIGGVANAQIYGGIYLMPGGVTIDHADSLTVYLEPVPDFDLTTWKVRAGLYLWRGSGNNASLVDTGAVQDIASSAAAAWHSFKLVNSPTVFPDSTYLLCVWSNATVLDGLELRYNAASTGDTAAHKNVVVGSWPNPLTGTTLVNSGRVSIYLTYTIASALSSESDTTACCLGAKDTSDFSSPTVLSIKNQMVFSKVTPSETFTTKSMRCFFISNATAGTRTMKCAVYLEADSTKVDTTEVLSFASGAAAAGWHTFLFPTPKVLTSGVGYLIGVWAQSTGTYTLQVNTKTTGGNGRWNNSQTYAAWPSPIPDASTHTATGRLEINLFYQNTATCPMASSSIKGRRRKIIESRSIGIIDWQLRDFVWESTKRFAGAYCEVAN